MSREKRRPAPDPPPAARPGTNMLDLQPSSADPMRQAGESIERLRREHEARPVKTFKRKKRKGRKI
jgi:hypothetical protein